MKLFGFTVEAKHESKWAHRDEFTALTQSLQDLTDQVAAQEKRIEATRVRLSQLVNAKSGNDAAEILNQGKVQANDPIKDILQRFG